MSEEDFRQIVVHPVMWDRLSEWLRTQNVELMRIPTDKGEPPPLIPTYIMRPIVL